MNNSTSNSLVFPVFATVFAEGQSTPIFNGVTTLPLVSESKLRKVLRLSFPNIRKACMCILAHNTAMACARPDTPSWFERAAGRFLFAASDPQPTRVQLLRAVQPKPKIKVTPRTVAIMKALNVPVKRSIKQKIAKATKKLSRSVRTRGHSKRKKAK